MDVFHRAGLIKKWDRGTNRVIEMCKKHGAPPPLFEERQGFLIVTFRAQLVAGGAPGTSKAQSGAQSEDPPIVSDLPEVAWRFQDLLRTA